MKCNENIPFLLNCSLKGEANVDCEIDKSYVSVEFPIGIRDIRIVYDYTMPLALYMVSGQAEIAFTVSCCFISCCILSPIYMWNLRIFQFNSYPI